MQKKTRKPIGLEALEDRWVPATVRFDGSNLYVSNLFLTSGKSNVVVVEQFGTDDFTVTDGTGNNGTYAVTGNIFISGNNAADTIRVIDDDTVGLLGNLTVHAGNGSDNVQVSSHITGTATIYGNLNVTLGNGVDTVAIGNSQGQNVGGSTYVSASGPGANVINLGGGTSTSEFAGNATISGFPSAFMGGVGAPSTVFAGNLTLENGGTTASSLIDLALTVQVYGNWATVGGQGATQITDDGNVLGAMTANLGNNTNTVFIATSQGVTLGSLSFTSGNGNNSLVDTKAANILGNVSLIWGNGANSLGSTTSLTVNGNFNLLNGNGSLDAATNPFSASVFGSATVNTGNGSNAFEVTEQASGTIGNGFNYTGGNGGNSVTVNNLSSNILELAVRMGNSPGTGAGGTGNNVFDITSGTTTATLAGSVSWGIPTSEANGNDYSDPGPYVWTNNAKLTNVPS